MPGPLGGTELQKVLAVILDDDPTGTQSATDASVLLDWDAGDIYSALSAEGAVYLQTNSRAVSADRARELAERIRGQIRTVERRLGQPVLVVLRGDSTLRGHVFTESDVFAGDDSRILFVPAFPQGGRRTRSSIHTVTIDGADVPVGETEFARDPVFGYHSSNLIEWTREVGDRKALPVPLDALRSTGGRAVADALAKAAPRELVIPDAESDADIELIRRGLIAALGAGVPVVVRSAATLAAACAGRLSTTYLARPVQREPGGVLVVCGSHTAAATAQLEYLAEQSGVQPVVIATTDALSDPEAAGRAATPRLHTDLTDTGLAIVATERNRRVEHDTLDDGAVVMRALMAAIVGLMPSVRTVVSKGGITSAEMARTGFGARTARVRGQIAPGISVWDFTTADRRGLQVIVPGNVGDNRALVDVLDALGIHRGEQAR